MHGKYPRLNRVNVIAKKEKKFGKFWARPGFEPGTTDPKSAMLTPRPRI